jgi:hypothetical protein
MTIVSKEKETKYPFDYDIRINLALYLIHE